MSNNFFHQLSKLKGKKSFTLSFGDTSNSYDFNNGSPANSYIQNFSKLKGKKDFTTSSNSKYGNTAPSSDCQNGYPVNRYAGYGVNAWEVLYSIWVANQSTLGAQFTANQCATEAPSTQPTTGPANIFIIRHSEKSSTNPNYCLNENGIYRACQLIEYVNLLAKNGTPISYIITYNPSPYNVSDPSMRGTQTAGMVSFMLNIPMYIYGSSQDFAPTVSQLFSSSSFDGLNVLIVWEHAAIQQLCLNILDAAGSLGRLPNGLTTGNEFFVYYNSTACPDGNFLATISNTANQSACSSPSPYIPPTDGSIPGVGLNTQCYPYWNTNDFNSVFWLKSDASSNYEFSFDLTTETCLTCYSSCDLHIGLYQPLNSEGESSNKYYCSGENLEGSCLVPSDWAVP
jgi:hypothetical protein